MFRVRLSTGEEAVYRSIEELALGISSGVVSEQSEIFHSKNQQWLPIARHPEYEAARERAAALVAAAVPEPAPRAAELPAGETGGPPVYQMFSISARELEERRRRKPRWRQHAVTIAAGLLFLISLAVAIRPERRPVEQATWPGRAVGQAQSTARSQRESVPTPQQLRAPYNLANRLTRAQAAATDTFVSAVAALTLPPLLDPARLTSPDSLRDNLAHLGALRPLVLSYRGQLHTLWAAYKDTSSTLIRSGAWDRLEAQEWLVRISTPEPRSDAVQADSLARLLDDLFRVLAAEPTPPRLAGGAIVLATDSAGLLYDRYRLEMRRLRVIEEPRTRRVGPPLTVLLTTLGSDTLPPRRPS